MLTLYYLMKKSQYKKPKYKLDHKEYYRTLTLNNRKKIQEDVCPKCRVCLQNGSNSIYGREDTALILEALEIIGNININETDDYPKFLCYLCNEFVQSAILFRKLARQSEEILKKPVKEESICCNETYDQDFSDGSDTKVAEQWPPEKNGPIKKENKIKAQHVAKVTCKVCNKVINRSYYKEHVTMHDPDHKKYVCDVCGKSFRLRCAYYNHSLRHRNDFPYKCQFCAYKARYSELLKTHMRTHTGDYRYMCQECPARFLFKSNLNTHMLKHKEPQFKCEACKRAFHTRLTLQRHFEADHLGIKNHVCNICGKAFGYRNAMMKHQRHVHKREKLLFGRMPAYLEAEHRSAVSE